MTRRAPVEDPRDARIQELEVRVAQLVDALVQLAAERPQYVPVPYPAPCPVPSPPMLPHPHHFYPVWGGSGGIYIGDLPAALPVTTVTVTSDKTIGCGGYHA